MPTDNSEPSLQEILQFDPFPSGGEGGDPPAGDPPPSGGTPPPAPSDEENQEDVLQTGGEEPPAPPPPVPPTPVSRQDLEQLISRQTEVITRATTPPAPQPQAPQNRFNLGVPDALVNALRSEDPQQFTNGVGALINGLANHLWNEMSAHLKTQMEELTNSVPRYIDSYASQARQQEDVARDFYGTYPQLDSPMLKTMVQTVGSQIAQEWAQSGRSLSWSPQLRDEIANRIFTHLPMLKAPPQQQQQRQPRRAFSTGNGTRPPAQTNSPENEMLEMVFGPTR